MTESNAFQTPIIGFAPGGQCCKARDGVVKDRWGYTVRNTQAVWRCPECGALWYDSKAFGWSRCRWFTPIALYRARRVVRRQKKRTVASV